MAPPDLPSRQLTDDMQGAPRQAPRIGTFDAIRRHKILFLLPLVLFIGAGAAYGFVRKPTYTAEARLQVGRLDVSQPGALAGFANATQALAATYSRAITADQIRVPVAQKTGLRPGQVGSHLTATPVREGAVIRVIANDKHRARAIDIANVATQQL